MNNEDCFENIFNGCKEFVIILGGEYFVSFLQYALPVGVLGAL